MYKEMNETDTLFKDLKILHLNEKKNRHRHTLISTFLWHSVKTGLVPVPQTL